MRILAVKWLILVGLSVALAACGSADDPETDNPDDGSNLIEENSVVDVAADAGLSAFVQALEDAFGDDEFRYEDGNSYTFFAPTNAALSAVDLNAGEDVLEYHVVEGTYTLEDLESGTLETLSGQALEVSVEGGDVSLNGEANIVAPNDLDAVNGVVHAIDSVLTPPEFDDPDEPEEPENNTFFADLGVIADGVESEATGEATATLEGETLSVTGSVQDLSSPITQVGLYEGGGDDAGLLFYELEVSGSTFSGDFALSQEELNILEANDFYITVSTETYPEGEVSGPLLNDEED